jgi:hypothetical protein
VELAVVGQTVTKVRTAGNEVVLLEERLTSIFEDGPQRTLAILQSDGHTVKPYLPPPGWSVVDFAVHPSRDISVILTTAREVRIVRLDPKGSIRSDQPFLDPAAPTDRFFNCAGGLKDVVATMISRMVGAPAFSDRTEFSVCTGQQGG